MSNFSRLVDLYRGAGLSSPLIKSLGSQAAYASIDSQLRRRQQLLSRAVQTGSVKPAQLSRADAGLLGMGPITGGGGSSVQDLASQGAGHHGIGGFFQNLGGDVLNFGRELVPGIAETGKAIASDIIHRNDPSYTGDKSQTLNRIIRPSLAGVGTDVSNVVHGRFGEIYQHPLNPLLDIATVASLGYGGLARGAGVLERAGLGDLSTSAGALRRGLTSTDRAPVSMAGQAELDREYSSRPFTRLAQKGTDALVSSPLGDTLNLHKLAYQRASRLNLRDKYSMMQLLKAKSIADNIKPLEQAFQGLSADESTALHLALRGANTPARLDAFQQLMRRSLNGENETGFNVTDFGNVDQRHVVRLANLSPEIRHLAEHPTEQMHTAAEAWAAQVSRGHEILDLPPEVHAEAVGKPQAILDSVGGKTPEQEAALLQDRAAPDSGGYEDPLDDPHSAETEINSAINEQLRPPSAQTDFSELGQEAHYEDTISHREGIDLNGLKEAMMEHPDQFPDQVRGAVLMGDVKNGTRLIHKSREHYPPVGEYNSLDFVTVKDGKTIAYGNVSYTDDGKLLGTSFYRDKKAFDAFGDYKDVELADTAERFARLAAPIIRKETGRIDGVPGTSVKATHREGQIAPNYAPDVSAENLQWHQPNVLGRAAGQEEGFRIRAGGSSDREITRENLLTPTPQSYLHTSSGELFTSGAFRVDKKVFLDHVARRETDIIDQGYKRDLINQYAAKGENPQGEHTTLKFKSQGEVDRKLGAGWKLVNESFPIQWYRHETDLIKEMKKSVDKLHEQGVVEGSPEFDDYLENLSAVDAKAFVRAHFGALKRPGVAVPDDFYQYQKSLTEAFKPLPGPLGAYQKFINYWRTLTLTFMPRWAINTAVGTFLQSMVKGTFNPRDWQVADKLRKEMPAGVSLGHVGISEDFGPQAMTMLERMTGAKVPTQKLAQGVQAIEDHFRRGMFVQSIRKADKTRLADMGETISSWYGKGMSNEEYVRQLIQDPQLVKRAIDETNKFAYNYAHLGPFERRYVRQVVPFWGWYKFITKLAWRLPVEYPGRARVMNMLSQVGLEAQDELGEMPDWLRGAIILNIHNKNLHYLSSMGLNPFAQFANPIDPHGSVNGLLQLGQLTPPIQAAVSAMGLDPLTGQLTPISPQDAVATGLFGNIVDPQGHDIAPQNVASGWRGLGALLRSFPQYRIAEKYLDQGGGTPFAENVPLLHHRAPMNPARAGAPVGIPAALLSYTGLVPKVYDLSGYQSRVKANKALYKSAHKRQLERLRRRDAGVTP